MKWKRKMEKARRLHRPSLENWERDQLHYSFPAYVAALRQQKDDYQALLLEGVPHPPSLPVVLDATTLSKDFFTEKLEAKGIPTVIANIPTEEGWPARNCWDLQSLNECEELRNRYFKCGEDDDGKSIKVKLKHFLQYLETNKDDSPLYIFDSGFDEDRKAKKILTDYQVPSYFRDDLFGLISEHRRPPYRWFLIGPERSGTTIHIDPLATSAWNTLLEGQKRWVLFPPHVPKHIAKGTNFCYDGEDDESIHYFMTILPRIKKRALEVGNQGDFKNFACYEFTQHAGETVFIPNGWWHGVLNLTHTVGITQNYCSPRNFDQVWVKTRTGRKLMAAKWFNRLEEEYPHLADRAKALNVRDRFRMKYDPRQVKRHDEAKHNKQRLMEEHRRQHSEHMRRERDAAASSDYDSNNKRSRRVSPP